MEVADIFRSHGATWVRANAGHVSLGQLKVISAIKACRTAALGGHVARCENETCAHTVIGYNSCRNRHCPKCQGSAAREWLAEREAELLNVPYYHIVFTVPAPIADLAYQNKDVIYDILFRASAETTLTIAADPKHLGARIAMTSVLHTWGSAMTHHSTSCGSVTSPCRTLQFAHDNTSPGGEIDVKESADYGPVVITKSINIIANGVTATVLAKGGDNAITINAGTSDAVYLQGLTVEGADVGYNGIVLNSGLNLIVKNCTIRGFAFNPTFNSGNGILLQPTSNARITISDTALSGNKSNGVYYRPPTPVAVNVGIVATRILVASNGSGIFLSGPDNGSHIVEIIDSTVSHNTLSGVSVYGRIFAIIDNARIFKNSNYGVATGGESTTFLRRSTIFGNEDGGVFVGSSYTKVYSYRDNSINANLRDLVGYAVLTAPLQ